MSTSPSLVVSLTLAVPFADTCSVFGSDTSFAASPFLSYLQVTVSPNAFARFMVSGRTSGVAAVVLCGAAWSCLCSFPVYLVAKIMPPTMTTIATAAAVTTPSGFIFSARSRDLISFSRLCIAALRR